MIGSDDTPIIEIGGVDYGPLGLKLVTGFNTEDNGARSIAQAGIKLLALANAGYTFPERSHTQIYCIKGSLLTRRLFGGFVVGDNLGRVGQRSDSGMKKTWDLACQGYNIALTSLVLPAVTDTNIYDDQAPAGTLIEQLQWAVRICQNPPGLTVRPGFPQVIIDDESGIAVAPGPHLDQSKDRFGGKALGFILQKICAAAMEADPSLKLRFYIGYDLASTLIFGFGAPTLHVYSEAIAARKIPLYYYTDDKLLIGTTVPTTSKTYQEMRAVESNIDSSEFVQWRQGQYGSGLIIEPTIDNSSSVSEWPNPLASDGTWKDELLSVTARNSDLAVGVLNRNISATLYPRQTIPLVSRTQTPASEVVGLHVDSLDMDPTPTIEPDEDRAWFLVRSSKTTWTPGAPVWAEMALGSRVLLPGESAEDDIPYPFSEKDKVKPQPPSGLSLDRNVYNPVTGKSELTYSWTASTSGDVRDYPFYYSGVGIGAQIAFVEGTSITIEVPGGVATAVSVQARDGNGNYSGADNAPSRSDTSASPLTERLYNGGFDYLDPVDATQAAGWHKKSGGGSGQVSTAVVLGGPRSLLLTAPNGQFVTYESSKFRVAAGLPYELSGYKKLAAGTTGDHIGVKVRFYTSDLVTPSILSFPADDSQFIDIQWKSLYLPFTPPADAVAAAIELTVYYDTANNALESAYFDDLTVAVLAQSANSTLKRPGLLGSDQATKLEQFAPTSGKTLAVARSLTLTALSDGLTLTIPASGTAALLGTANVFTAANRFNGSLGIDAAPPFNSRLGMDTTYTDIASGTMQLYGKAVFLQTANSGAAYQGINSEVLTTNTGHNSGTIYGQLAVATARNLSPGTLTALWGIQYKAQSLPATSAAITTMGGGQFYGYHQGTGAVGALYGVQVETRRFAGAGAVTDAVAGDFTVTSSDTSAALTNGYALRSNAPGGTGTITTQRGHYILNQGRANIATSYGLEIANQSGAVTSVALKTGSGAVQFGDHVTLADGKNIITGTSTGMQIGTAANQKIGFFGATPQAKSPAYTVSNYTTRRTLDKATATVGDLFDFACTLVADLQPKGLP